MKIIVIGAGPTGLGAAYRLTELGYADFTVYDKNDYVGGLAASFQDGQGFTWDFAVHVAHSHYDYFDRLMEKALPNGFNTHTRKSWVREYGAYVPYPFQYNFRHLPKAAREECLEGLEKLAESKEKTNRKCTQMYANSDGEDGENLQSFDSHKKHKESQEEFEQRVNRGQKSEVECRRSSDEVQSTKHKAPVTFEEWIHNHFGEGIAKHFMIPYNTKIWSTHPRDMAVQWLGDRVPVVDLERVQKNIADGRDDVSWGPNAHFQFPKEGGTGAVWKGVAGLIPPEHIRLETEVISIDSEKKTVTLADGTVDHYDALISTMPIPVLSELAHLHEIRALSSKLTYTHTFVVCIAVPYALPENLQDKTWLYCPEDNTVFYRVTPFSLFSPAHVPDPDRWCSFMCEISRPGADPMADGADFVEDTLKGLTDSGILPSTEGAHVFTLQSAFGYPVATLDRDALLDRIQPELKKRCIYSRGRFGGWKYEVANMDHSVMQGVEAVDHILEGKEEVTYFRPDKVNG